MDNIYRRVKDWSGLSRKPATPELSRSQYSLVSTGELTAEALQVWLKLPKKIKYDPDLEPFQKRYEKEIASKQENIALKLKNGSVPESKRLPLVKSAPHLNNNRVEESPSAETKLDGVEIQSAGKNIQR
ncbi:uncharacterized protein LOC123668289 [Melitaea cinxia]|uniref:uncharacterized protein LOC123668289 n=1 Tax=Melitaea cinxia TaxID=113334 RepID=UPI001E274534|nr:uncharacterized protein LOC123668289 [Melitaea cinxia]XP_045458010.1 uncharacterized protein LOC123668289 [Melitaea cinxia]